MKVIVDTNGLMVQTQFGVDVFEELARLGYDERVIPSAVVDELKSLENKLKGKDKIALAVALSLSKQCRVVEAPGNADEVILEMAKAEKVPVFTNDALLRKQLKSAGVRTIFLRSKHKLEID